ncbi:MAG TPA: hypothetical protein VKE72_03210 [Methylocella sp.]|jgi:hypothetical protein|nr:hypothetical protein [Methylocella sp.]
MMSISENPVRSFDDQADEADSNNVMVLAALLSDQREFDHVRSICEFGVSVGTRGSRGFSC